MGFYGNISNINKTNMTFDKIYSNRKSMDESCALDGVYIGRYVLVEYQQYYPLDALDNYPIIYKVGENAFSDRHNVQNPNPNWIDGQVYRCISLDKWSNSEPDLQYYIYSFYKWSESEGKMMEITSEQDEGNYINNFNIDKDEYHSGRGYDSTVWMKQYDNSGNPRYVNIAELNSVVPTFDVSVDAPSEIPQFPHFDEDSTNIYYNLHVQPSWGFRIGERPSNKPFDMDANGNTVETTHYYIDNNGEKKPKIVKADIYFNKAGFNKENKNAYVELDDVGADYINIIPSGISGNLYNNHIKNNPKQTANDIQEISINLPSIGNMMSDAWDIIHGPNRDNDKIVSLQGRLDSFQELKDGQIPVAYTNGGELRGNYLKDLSLTGFSSNINLEGNIDNTDTLETALNKIQNEIGNPSYEIQDNDVSTIVESTGLYQYIDSHVQILFKEIEDKEVEIDQSIEQKELKIYDYIDNQALYAKATTNKGSALSAVKLDTSAGSSKQPVYFNEGIPVSIGYTVEASVPFDAVFTDTTYEIVTDIKEGLMSIDDKKKLDNIDNEKIIYIDTTFNYNDNQITIQALVDKIIELEQKIANLESYHTTTTE